MRRFNPIWFHQYGSWLEYSVLKEKDYCLCCYLFRDDAYPGFVKKGFSSWHKPDRLFGHVGEPNSSPNTAAKKCDDLMNQSQSIIHAFYKKDDAVKNVYCIRLQASIDVSRHFLKQRLSFRGHDESEESANRGNFLELMKYTADHKEVISKVVLKNAPRNNQMVALMIQKDIVNFFAEEIVKSIIEEIDHGVFGMLVDESADVSGKEQMDVVLRFVDKRGVVKELFVGVVQVAHLLLYRLLKLVLTLPVAIASVERCFFDNETTEDSHTQSNWKSFSK